MNANEIFHKKHFRMNRIQKVSAIFRTFFFTIALLSGLGGISLIISGLMLHTPDPAASMDRLLTGMKNLTWAVGLWFGYRLFKFYAAGDLFSSRIVGCLKQIGAVAVLIGVVTCSTSAIQAASSHPMPLSLAVVFILELFFSAVPGSVIFCVAWIMDEGRKIREEQELTV